MQKKRVKEQKTENAENVIDSYESWLEGQHPKPVSAKHGFIADAKIKASS